MLARFGRSCHLSGCLKKRGRRCGHKRGRPLTGLGEPLRRVLARAGLQNIRVHDIRRTVGSWLAQSGVSLHLIGDVLNHRDLRTTMGYAYFQTHQRRQALNGHASKILSHAATHFRVTTQPKVLLAESLLRVDSLPSRHRHYFERESLHELVWTAPCLRWRNGSGYPMLGLQSSAGGLQYPHRDVAIGLASNQVRGSAEHLSHQRLQVCRHC